MAIEDIKSGCRYEYVYGVNPFANKNYKIVRTMILRYPVVFADQVNGTGNMNSDLIS
jgi:hypothetical protein